MRTKRFGLILAIALLVGACAPAAEVPGPGTPLPETTPEEPNSPSEPVATIGADASRLSAPGFVQASTAFPDAVAGWRPPPYSVPWALRPEDHFYFSRPIPSGEVNWPHPRFRYGGTFFGEESTHTGVDLGAKRDTPVLAAGSGEVVWTGYGFYRGIPDEEDPYGLAIAIRHDFGYEGQPLYTVYAHLTTSVVWRGQLVEGGQVIGTVGDTGHASGPHLHFEVRLGENYYFSTRNPELWTAPPEGWGVLAGRVLDTYGRPLAEQVVRVTSVDTGQEWEVWTYALGTVVSDAVYNENFVLGDLPAGPYQVDIDFQGLIKTAWLFVLPGQTTFLVFQGTSGFRIEPTPTPSALVSR